MLASLASHAQTEKGTQTFGLDLGFSSNKSNIFNVNPVDNSTSSVNSKTTNFNIGPDYSYFITDKLDIGTSLSYGKGTTNSDATYNPTKQSSYAYGGTIYIRKYFMYQNKIGLRAGPYAGYTRSDYKTIYPNDMAIYSEDSKTDNFNAGVKLELVYYPSKCLGVSAMLADVDYNHSKTNSGNQGHSSSDDVNVALINNLSLSVFYAFGGK